MPSAKKKSVTSTPTDEAPAVEVVALAGNQSLANQIRTDVASVPTEKLIPFYVTGKKIVDHITAMLGTVKEELVVKRRESGKKAGTQSQHRKFEVGEFGLTLRQSQKDTLDLIKTEELLREKGLMEDASDLVIEAGVDELQRFLRKHRTEVQKMGLVVREVLNEEKIQALVSLKKISIEELSSLIQKGEPQWAVVIDR